MMSFLERPGLLIQRPYQNSGRLPELIRVLNDRHGRALDLAVVANVPHQQESGTARFFDDSGATHRIADPMLFKHRSHLGTAGPMETARHQYLQDDIPDQPDDDWVRGMLDVQRRVGASLLLSPTGWITEVEHRRGLETAMETVRRAREIIGDEQMLVSLALSEQWLRDRELLHSLLAEVVESDERDWYVRVRWRPLEPATGQLRDAVVLDGYRQLTQLMALEGKRLLLPNTSLAGWLATAWGAAALGTGFAQVDRHFTQDRVVAIPGTDRPPPRERWFEASVLHIVETTARASLTAQAGYERCPCEFCREYDSAGWTREREALHFVWSVAELLRHPPAASAGDWVRSKVQRAQQFWAAIPDVMQPGGDNRPTHLGAWAAQLRQ